MKTFLRSADFIDFIKFQDSSTGKITGQVTDNKNKIVEFATITLLQAKDSSLVKGALADANGTFEFEKIKFGSI
jgi:hypothetical protein